MGADPFGNRAAKLGALTCLGERARVLMVGLTGTGWEAEFAATFGGSRSVTFLELNASLGPHDLTVCMLDEVKCDVTSLRAVTAPSGWLILMVRHPRSVVRGRRHPHWDPLITRVRDAGFTDVAAYAATPSLVEAEEYLGAGAFIGATPTPCVAWWRAIINRLLNRQPDVVLMCTTHGRSLLTDLESIGETAPLRIERFALRARGVLLLIVSDESGRRFVIRVTTSDVVDRIVSRNALWTGRIREHPRMSAWGRARVPRQAGCRRRAALTVYMEDCLPGEIGWKVARKAAMEQRLFNDVWQFAEDLAEATKERRRLSRKDVAAMLTSKVSSEAVDQGTIRLEQQLRDSLTARVADNEAVWTWSHGDFGYGNVVADAKTAALNGVIDWDQARVDLSGVDLLNFLIQRHRIIHGSALPAAVAAVCDPLLNATPTDPRLAGRLPGPGADVHTLVAWTLLRMTQRDGQYPSNSHRSRDDLHAVLLYGLALVERG